MRKQNTSCVICASKFYASPGHLKKGWGIYCTIKCRSVGFLKEGNGRFKKNEGRVICKNCKQEFHQKPCSILKGKSKVYCSKKCREERIGKVKVICDFCKKEFEVSPCQIAKIKKYGVITCSKQCSGANHHKKPMNIPRHKSGMREDIGIYVRSRWEANYARYLNILKENGDIKDWKYEQDTFIFDEIKRGTRSYTPDFKIINNDSIIEYHEIKGYMDDKSRIKLKRMEKYYPNIKVIVIDGDAYYKLAKTIKPMIQLWESDARGR